MDGDYVQEIHAVNGYDNSYQATSNSFSYTTSVISTFVFCWSLIYVSAFHRCSNLPHAEVSAPHLFLACWLKDKFPLARQAMDEFFSHRSRKTKGDNLRLHAPIKMIGYEVNVKGRECLTVGRALAPSRAHCFACCVGSFFGRQLIRAGFATLLPAAAPQLDRGRIFAIFTVSLAADPITTVELFGSEVLPTLM
jgi:hypothetical protein